MHLYCPAGEGLEPKRLLYSYYTAGSGGAGPTILETSFLLAGEASALPVPLSVASLCVAAWHVLCGCCADHLGGWLAHAVSASVFQRVARRRTWLA